MIQWPNSVSELTVHPHCEEERAGRYHALDGGSAEVEVLEFLEALVRLFKPATVLETGTAHGLSTMALVSGLRSNGFGRLHTVEIDPAVAAGAQARLREYGGYLQSHVADSREFLQTYDGPAFELCFFDSLLHLRAEEYKICERRGRLAPHAVCAFHDTSALRVGPDTCPEFQEFLTDLRDRYPGGLTCRYSRGLTVVQRNE